MASRLPASSIHAGDDLAAESDMHLARGPTARLLYSVEEAADLLGIGRTFMFHLVATGEIDSFKIGKRRKIPRGALDDYIERLRSEQAAAAAARRSG